RRRRQPGSGMAPRAILAARCHARLSAARVRPDALRPAGALRTVGGRRPPRRGGRRARRPGSRAAAGGRRLTFRALAATAVVARVLAARLLRLAPRLLRRGRDLAPRRRLRLVARSLGGL